jgi:hypothetical protein
MGVAGFFRAGKPASFRLGTLIYCDASSGEIFVVFWSVPTFCGVQAGRYEFFSATIIEKLLEKARSERDLERMHVGQTPGAWP